MDFFMPQYSYIGNHKELPTNAKVGDICTIVKYGDSYLYSGNKWVPIYCIDNQESHSSKSHPVICKQCGAILKGNTCEYCGATYIGE